MVEGALVFASIILGLGVTDQLTSLHRLLRARRRVRWDWAAPVVALLVLLTIIQFWWSIAGQRGALTIGAYLPMLGELILLFLLAAAVLPDEVPSDGLDLRTYYDDNGSYIWTLYAAALGWLLAASAARELPSGGGLRPFLDRYLIDLAVVAVMASLIFVRRRWWHALALLFLAVGPVAWLSRSLGAP